MWFIRIGIFILLSCQYGQATLPYRVSTFTFSTQEQCTILKPGNNTSEEYKKNVVKTLSGFVPSCHCTDYDRFWTRVAYLKMKNSSQSCPSPWTTAINISVRACGRQFSLSGSCNSVFYSTNGLSYSHVCGRIHGYQFYTPNAFHPSITGDIDLDSWYVDGVSLTHGLPKHRTHVWTFANAWYETASNKYKCPCMLSNSSYWPYTVPSFVGNNYFCATGSYSSPEERVITDDLLWDGVGCTGNNTCCQFNQPPWFCRTLPTATSDDLEVRICGDQATDNENTFISYIELFVI